MTLFVKQQRKLKKEFTNRGRVVWRSHYLEERLILPVGKKIEDIKDVSTLPTALYKVPIQGTRRLNRIKPKGKLIKKAIKRAAARRRKQEART